MFRTAADLDTDGGSSVAVKLRHVDAAVPGFHHRGSGFCFLDSDLGLLAASKTSSMQGLKDYLMINWACYRTSPPEQKLLMKLILALNSVSPWIRADWQYHYITLNCWDPFCGEAMILLFSIVSKGSGEQCWVNLSLWLVCIRLSRKQLSALDLHGEETVTSGLYSWQLLTLSSLWYREQHNTKKTSMSFICIYILVLTVCTKGQSSLQSAFSSYSLFGWLLTRCSCVVFFSVFSRHFDDPDSRSPISPAGRICHHQL